MKKNSDHNIIIINPVPDVEIMTSDEWREEAREEKRFLGNAVKISSETLRKNADLFLEDISSVLDNLTTSVQGFDLDSVEVSAAITVTGKFGLMSMGAEFGGEGSLKFIFKKKT
jgi:hypothetical protein